MDHAQLLRLRREHPAWRLLAARNAPLIAAFLHATFIEPNLRTIAEGELNAQLTEFLRQVHRDTGEDVLRQEPGAYLDRWADDEHGWLRRSYPPDTDEPHYDLTPPAEQALRWLDGLEERAFIGAESRLKVVFDLLREIDQGSESDPQVRIAELERQRAAIDAEIDAVRAGRAALMDATRLRERFLQASDTARGLLADFRQVEQNFRELDRQVRERVAGWEGSRSEVLDEVFGQHDAIVAISRAIRRSRAKLMDTCARWIWPTAARSGMASAARHSATSRAKVAISSGNSRGPMDWIQIRAVR